VLTNELNQIDVMVEVRTAVHHTISIDVLLRSVVQRVLFPMAFAY
jgi:hypothetical protein